MRKWLPKKGFIKTLILAWIGAVAVNMVAHACSSAEFAAAKEDLWTP